MARCSGSSQGEARTRAARTRAACRFHSLLRCLPLRCPFCVCSAPPLAEMPLCAECWGGSLCELTYLSGAFMFTLRHRCRRDDALRRLGNNDKQTVVREGRSDRSTFCQTAFESGCRGSEVPKVARPSPNFTGSFTDRRSQAAEPLTRQNSTEELAEGSGDCAEMVMVMTALTASDSLGSSGGNVVVRYTKIIVGGN